MLAIGDTTVDRDVRPFRCIQISFHGGNPGPKLSPLHCKAKCLKCWGHYQLWRDGDAAGEYPCHPWHQEPLCSSAATLSLPMTVSSLAAQPGEHRDAALHPRVSLAPGWVLVQGTVPKPVCESEDGAQ